MVTKEEKLFQIISNINENSYSDYPNNYKIIRDKVNRDSGNYVDINGLKGILVGAVEDIDDYYYLVLSEDRKIRWCSCCAGYKLLGLDQPNQNFSVLHWLKKNEPEELHSIVWESINNDCAVPISDIKINP